MPLLGELAALGAALVWSSSISGFAQFGKRHSALALTTLKGCVAVLFLIAAWAASGAAAPSAQSAGLLVLSGLLGVAVGEPTFFLALQRLGPELPTTMMCLVPVLVAWPQCMGPQTALCGWYWKNRCQTPR